MMKRFLLLFVCLMMIFSSAVLAVDDENVLLDEEIQTSAGMTPDSLFWSLDVAFDKLSLALTRGEAKRADKVLEIAQERLSEIEAMVEENKLDQSEKAKEKHDEMFEKLEEELEASKNTDDEENYKQQLDIETKIAMHKERVDSFEARIEIKGELTADQEEKLNTFLESLGDRVEQAEIKVQTRRDETRVRLQNDHSEEEIEKFEETRYEHLSEVAQAQAKRAIASAEKKLSPIKEPEPRSDLGIKKEERNDDLDREAYAQKQKERFEDDDEMERPSIDPAFLLDNCLDNLQERYPSLSEEDAKKQCADLGRAKTQEPNAITGNVVQDDADAVPTLINYKNEVEVEEEFEIEIERREVKEKELVQAYNNYKNMSNTSNNRTMDYSLGNILDQFDLEIPKYETRSMENSQEALAKAKEALKTSMEKSEEAEYKAAYAYAVFARKLANVAMAGKYMGTADDDESDDNDDEADEEEEEEVECTTDADCEAGEYCDEDECEDSDDEMDNDEDDMDNDELEEDEEEVECTTNSDCDADEECIESECEDIEEEMNVEGDDDSDEGSDEDEDDSGDLDDPLNVEN